METLFGWVAGQDEEVDGGFGEQVVDYDKVWVREDDLGGVGGGIGEVDAETFAEAFEGGFGGAGDGGC